MPHLETDLVLPKSLESFPTWITKSSGVGPKRAAERIATYFKREMSYDFLQYAAADHNSDCIVYSWDSAVLCGTKTKWVIKCLGQHAFAMASGWDDKASDGSYNGFGSIRTFDITTTCLGRGPVLSSVSVAILFQNFRTRRR